MRTARTFFIIAIMACIPAQPSAYGQSVQMIGHGKDNAYNLADVGTRTDLTPSDFRSLGQIAEPNRLAKGTVIELSGGFRSMLSEQSPYSSDVYPIDASVTGVATSVLFRNLLIGARLGYWRRSIDRHSIFTFLPISLAYVFGTSWTHGPLKYKEDRKPLNPHQDPSQPGWYEVTEHWRDQIYAKSYWFLNVVGCAWPSSDETFAFAELGFGYSFSFFLGLEVTAGADYEEAPNTYTAFLRLRLICGGGLLGFF